MEPKLNVKLLRAVQRRIATSPDFDMHSWRTCVAGMTCRELGVSANIDWRDITGIAAGALGLRSDEQEQLFYLHEHSLGFAAQACEEIDLVIRRRAALEAKAVAAVASSWWANEATPELVEV